MQINLFNTLFLQFQGVFAENSALTKTRSKRVPS